jgi:hypothetical protein
VSDEAHTRLPRVTGAEFAFEWFCRGIAVCCTIFGLYYWVRLIGLYDGVLWRFDLMPLHWQVAAVVLSVLFPIATTGLWMTVSWGAVIWLAAAATEVGMYGGFPEFYGSRPALVAFHVMTVIIFVALRVLLYFEERRRRERL